MKPMITNEEKGYISTHEGELMFVNVTGQGKANYNGDGFDYVATVQLSGEAAKAAKDEIDAFIETNKPKKTVIRAKHKPYHTHKDSDKIPKGCVRLNFKTNTTFESGDQTHIKIFNGKLQQVQMSEGSKIGNGSIGRISGKIAVGSNAKEWWLSLFLSNLQLRTFVEYEENSGFEEMEDSEFDNFDDAKAEKKKKKGKKSDDDESEEKPKKKKKKKSKED